MLQLFSIPDATTTLESIGDWSMPIFSSFSPFIWWVCGIIIGIFAVRWIIHTIKDIFG